MPNPFPCDPSLDDVHWDRATYLEAQTIYANMQRQIALLQSLNATLYRRIRNARRNYQLDQAAAQGATRETCN